MDLGEGTGESLEVLPIESVTEVEVLRHERRPMGDRSEPADEHVAHGMPPQQAHDLIRS
jgi:hypothetical protein